jgi:hypothetical protein
MSLTLQSWVDQAVQQARRYRRPLTSPVLEVLGNALFAGGDAEVGALDGRQTPGRAPSLRKSKTVAFTNGAGTLSDDVLTEYAQRLVTDRHGEYHEAVRAGNPAEFFREGL